ncbi:MAG: hypothetical protein QNJ97_21920 [Myxococcota bacterium]|nr:hypothetical protein [Myxococcota bacterium]
MQNININERNRCQRCVMSDDYPGLTFDDDGVCNFCIENDKNKEIDWKSQKKALDAKIDDIKNKATKYHVVVPWSGGKDSSYVLYTMKEVYGLNVLAINYDNGFKSDTAYKNMDVLTRKMGIDLVTLRPDPTLMADLYRHYLKEKGELCSVCNVVGYVMICSYVFRESLSLGYFPLVAGGWSGKHENVRSIFTFDYPEFKRVIKKDKALLDRFENNILVTKEVCDLFETIGDPRVAGDRVSEVFSLMFFQLPEYIEWDIIKIKETLSKELDWYSSDSPIAAHEDCKWHNCMKYLMLKKYGIDNDTIALSTLVRSNQLSRERALKEIRKINKDAEPPEMEALLNTINCSKQDVNWDSDWYTGDNVKK